MALNRLLGNETRINLSFVACIDDVESDAKPRLPVLSSAGADALNLAVPLTLQASADEVIE